MKIIKYLFITINLIFFGSSLALAQFTTATVTETAATSGATGVANTGNDIITYIGNRVLFIVWDSNNGRPGIAFNDFNGNFNDYPLQNSDAKDPDVAIVTNGTNYYAAVVYHSASTGVSGSYVLEFYTFNGLNLALLTGSPITLMAGNYGSAINIDANSYGDFAIVFDIDSAGIRLPKLLTGSMPTTSPVLNYNTPKTMIPTSPYSVKFPDVCLWDSTFIGTELVYASYVNTNTNNIVVQVERWPNVNNLNPIIGNTIHGTITPSSTYLGAPRIACGTGASSRFNVSVVYGRSGNEISSWTTDPSTGSPYTNTYTNASYGSGPITAAPNFNPVVSYDGNGNHDIFYGWTYDNSVPNYTGALYHPNFILPVVVRADKRGSAISTRYWDVPRNLNGIAKVLSICGRRSNNIGTSYFDDSNNTVRDVYYKANLTPTSSLRTTLGNSNESSKVNYCSSIKIFDVQGKLIHHKVFEISDINQYLINLNINSGLYFIKTISDSQENILKYFKL